jgi:hypothetical protein
MGTSNEAIGCCMTGSSRTNTDVKVVYFNFLVSRLLLCTVLAISFGLEYSAFSRDSLNVCNRCRIEIMLTGHSPE